MQEKIVFQPAWVRCIGPERHHFTTAERVRQKAHYYEEGGELVGFTIPQGSLDKVRCPECDHQVEEVRDAQGWAVRPPRE
jgi:hypothetical protein